MLRIKSMIYLTGQVNFNDRKSKSQTKKTIAHAAQAPVLRALNRFGIWSLRFVWNLPARRPFGGVLGICDLIDLCRSKFKIS
ncbi:MAG: hypothetical protein R6U40_05180 [Desulfobacterales bacterium]